MKKLNILSVFLLTVFFSYTVIAQEFGSLRRGYEFKILTKIHKLVLDPLPSGTYSVGSGGYFPTVDSVFNKLSIDGIAGEVILELIDDLYTAPADTFGFLLDGPIPGAGPNSRVTIKPAENKNVTLEGNWRYVVTFINVSYLTFDGINTEGSTTLTIHSLYNSQYVTNRGVTFVDNSNHNIVKNLTILCDDIMRDGIGIFFSTTLNSLFAPDSNLIENNFIKKAGVAIVVGGYFAASNTRPKGNIIRWNKVGSETDSLIAWGIQLEKSQNSIVENNIVQNLTLTNSYSWDNINIGINSYWGSGDIIRNNIVHNIKASSGYTGVGILLSGGSGLYGNNVQVYNNMVYNIQSTSTQSDSRVAGIEMWCQNSPKIYYNSIYLSGSGASHSGSAAFYVYGGFGSSSNIDLKNNIFVNTRDESPYWASAIYDYSNSNLGSDNNDLYSGSGQNNCLVKIGGIKYNALSDWQATGKDLNSLNESVNFVSSNDLHISNNYNTIIDQHATPIAGIEADFDGELRDASLPDIGADEFELSPMATNWQLQNSNFPSDILVVDFSAPNNDVCWAVGIKYPPYSPYAGYIRTIDGGNTWVCDTIPGLSNSYVQQIFAIDADTAYVTIFKLIGTSGSNGIYKTTDAGGTWVRQEAYNNSQSGPAYIHFFDAQNGVVIGDPGIETYTTTNGGLTWNPVTMPAIPSNEYTASRGDGIVAVGNTVWFSTGAHLFKSSDKGYTWDLLLSEPQYINWSGGIAFQDTLKGIYSQKMGGSTNHLYRKTTDGGVTWNTISNSVLDQIAATTSQYIPGTAETYLVGGSSAVTMSGIAVTYDGGNTWSLIDTIGSSQFIFPSATVGWNSPFTVHNIYKYVGPRITTVEEKIVDIVPIGYSLSQNYPNPFNPSTTFRYSIPTESKVVIKVYDILGNEIETLVSEEKQTGTYELTWNAGKLSSGIYFYQLRAGEFVVTKKMLLLK